jgi:hypothetical protein
MLDCCKVSDPGNLGFGEMGSCPSDGLVCGASHSPGIAGHGLSEHQCRTVAFGKQRARAVIAQLLQQNNGQQRLSPAMPSQLDAPTAPAKLGRILSDEQLEPFLQDCSPALPTAERNVSR